MSAHLSYKLFPAAMLACGLWVMPAFAQQVEGVPAVKSSTLTSLFYGAPEREAIAQARKQYMERDTQTESEADLLDQLQGIKEATQKPKEELQEKVYAQFYLETLIYHKPSDWTIWLREGEERKRYTAEEPVPAESALKIIAINKEDISFTWKPRSWTAVSNAYKEGTPGVNIDKEKQQVVFTLRVNQMLASKEMEIKEGYTPPVATESAQAAQGGDAKAADTNAKPAAAKPQAGKPVAPAAQPKPQAGGKKPATVLELYKSLEPADNQKP